MESIAPMRKLQIIAFIFRTEMPFIALQIFIEGSTNLICKIDRGLGIMSLEISGAFLSLHELLRQKRIPLFLLAGCVRCVVTTTSHRPALKVSGPSRDSVNADRTLRHHPFVFSEFSSAGRMFIEVYPQRIW